MKDKSNIIIISITIVCIVAIITLGVVSAKKNISQENNQVSTSTVSNTKILASYEGEQTLEKLSEISSCPLTTDKDAFAKCLTEKGFVMYGAVWCAHCINQKKMFGESFKYIKYVECPDNIQFCLDQGIKGYPTWMKEI